LIKPNESLGNMFDFTKERAINNIQLGYYDTLGFLKVIKAAGIISMPALMMIIFCIYCCRWREQG